MVKLQLSMRSPGLMRSRPLPLSPKIRLFPQINPKISLTHHSTNPSAPCRLFLCLSKNSSISPITAGETLILAEEREKEEVEVENQWRTEEGSPKTLPSIGPKLSITDQAFFLFAFIACTTSVAFTSLVIAAVPMLHAMGRAAVSLSKLADTAREELPSTMAAIRLSGMEISDLTLELSDLSQEIAEGVNRSAQAVQAAEAGIRQIGTHARQQTMSMIEERANLPNLSIQPVVVGAAKKTSRAVGQATKTLMNMIYKGEYSSDDQNTNAIERLEI